MEVNILSVPYSSQQVLVCGDIHDNIDFIIYKIKVNNIKDTVFIVAGDCGIGFEKPQHYVNWYNRNENVLLSHNVTLLLVRGNHDDPLFFNGEERIDFEYFKTIPDYTVIQLTDLEYILCVGGACSVDRVPRIRRNFINMANKDSSRVYWPDEEPFFSKEKLDAICDAVINVSYVVTHTIPIFFPILQHADIDQWAIEDSTLLNDIEKERQTLSDIYDYLTKDCECTVKKWFCGHFHEHITFEHENTLFIVLDRVRANKMEWDVVELNYC